MIKQIKEFLRRPYLYIIIILIGTGLKFYQIDNRLFWVDEISTVLHTSGIPLGQYSDLIPINEIRSSKSYNDILHLNTQKYTISEQIKGLFSDTHLTPLHYVPLMIWHRIVGDDPMDYRLFSVFIFIITLPFLFLLAKQLFKSELSAWIAVSLYSVSPTFHLFAQESRYYILWAFILILFHYLFLKALQHNQLKWWIGYTITGILALYTSVISGIVIFGHLLYVLVLRRKLWLTYGINASAMLLIYTPWIYSMLINRNEIFEAMSWQINQDFNVHFILPFLFQLMGFLHVFIYFVDWSQYTSGATDVEPPMMASSFFLMILFLVLLIMAIVYLFRKSSREIKYFLLFIVLPIMLFYYTLDLIRNGWLSVIWRYHMVSLTGIVLIMANYLGSKIKDGKIIYSIIFVSIIFVSLFSISILSHNKCWMTRYDCPENIADAKLFRKSGNTLLVTDFAQRIGNFMVVLNESGFDNIDVLYASPNINNVEDKISDKMYSDILVVHATNDLVHNLKSQFGTKMDSLEINQISPIWRIENN